jgi:hypothetical protein
MHLTTIEVRAARPEASLYDDLSTHFTEDADDLKIIAIIFGSVYMLITAIEVRSSRSELIRAKQLTSAIGIWTVRRSNGRCYSVASFHEVTDLVSLQQKLAPARIFAWLSAFVTLVVAALGLARTVIHFTKKVRLNALKPNYRSCDCIA